VQKIKAAEENLIKAMDTNDFFTVDRALTDILNQHIDIDVKLLHKGEREHLRLQRELDIAQFIKSVDHLDDYKVIRKSVETLNKKVQAAKDMGVELSDETLRLVN
jgi:hypothetical protein